MSERIRILAEPAFVAIIGLGFALRIGAGLFVGTSAEYGRAGAMTVILGLSVLGIAVIVCATLMARTVHSQAERYLCAVLLAVHPTLLLAPLESFGGAYVAHAALVLAALACYASEYKWVQAAGRMLLFFWAIGILIASTLGMSDAAPIEWWWVLGASQFDTWGLWSFARDDSSLRSVLSAYLFEYPILALAIAGVVYSFRRNAWLVLLALSVIGFVWSGSALRIFHWQQDVLLIIFPLLIVFATTAISEIYRGLGRTGGHGILAIDPVRDKPRPRPSQVDG